MNQSTTDSKPRVRFAPSPTGMLHVGGARTAIYNWAFARHNGGTFVLRIDDTDPERSTKENTQIILRAMSWLGLDWDEGPCLDDGGQERSEGDYGPYFQTQRSDFYAQALQKMRDNGSAYPCFCTPEELTAKREAAKQAGVAYEGYDRSCRNLDPAVAQARIDAGEPHCWRLKVPLDHGPVEFDDAVRGRLSFPIDVLDDFVLVRSDGTPTYNFASVVDDACMGITHIIRGDDHISNTPKQILVFEALGAPLPTFAHLSMIWGPDGKKLSKRHGATSVEEYKAQGYLPEVMVNYLALLGWALDGETTKFSKDTLCEHFTLDHISKNPAIFDAEKLDWLNSVYIREFSPDEFLEHLVPHLIAAGLCTQQEVEDKRDWFLGIRPLIFERIKRMTEAPAMVAYLFSGPTVSLDEASVAKVLAKEGSKAILEALEQALAADDLEWDAAAIEAALRALPPALGQKPKTVFQVARVALCGNMVSPPLFESIHLIGREDSIARLKAAESAAM